MAMTGFLRNGEIWQCDRDPIATVRMDSRAELLWGDCESAERNQWVQRALSLNRYFIWSR